MGSSSSRHRRNDRHRHRHHHLTQPQSLLPSPPPPPPPPPLSSITTSVTSSNSSTNNNSNALTHHNNSGGPSSSSSFSLTNATQPIRHPPPPPGYSPNYPPPPPGYSPNYPPPGFYNAHNYHARPPPPPSYNGWAPNQQPVKAPTAAPPPYVDHTHAKTVKNDVNVHKDSIKLVFDESTLESHVVSFIFDALVDGSITIIYFAKEGDNCTFIPVYPEIYMPKRVPFKKGLGQKFTQPSGTGIDLGFFELDQLSKPSSGEEIFPLVIFAEASLPSVSSGAEPSQTQPTRSPHAQITQAVLEKNKEDHFQAKVIKQILWIDQVRYELREIYGIASSDEASIDDSDTGTECVICMTEPKDTAVLPCRHMCLCGECANALRLQSDKCPICRQPIKELMEIKITKDGPPTS